MQQRHIDAIKLLGAYTAGRFDIWALAGPQRASCRAHVMSIYNGQKTPQRQAGVSAMIEAFHVLAFNEDAPGFKASDCMALRERAFIEWARALATS